MYIPGLGDAASIGLQWRLLQRWPNHTQLRLFQPKWHAHQETFQQKFQRLTNMVADFEDYAVVAVSAGGSLAMNLVASHHPPARSVLISAKLANPRGMGPYYDKLAPALRDSVKASARLVSRLSSNQTNNILVVRPMYDGLIPKADMVVADAKTIRLPILGHPTGIGLALILYGGRLMRWTLG